MRMRFFGFLLIFFLLFQQPAGPCAPAPPSGARVTILDESAFIVWDPEKRIQHFIRRASFESDAKDFGFLVPTPQTPELSELPNEVFQVGHLMAPEEIYQEEKGVRPVFFLAAFFFLGRGSDYVTAPPPRVRLLQETTVAGYDAAVLEADDSDALNDWLKEHGYPSSPALQEWFEPYVAMKWKITAFKISGDQTTGNISTSAVRMSFSTDHPFFPYREPRMETGEQNRNLQILMLSPERMEGKLGQNFAENWPGKTVWADKLEPKDAAALLDKLKISMQPRTLWLIDFEDTSSPRPGHADLFFRIANDQTPVLPPPVIITRDARIPIPIDLLIVITLVALWIYRRKRKR